MLFKKKMLVGIVSVAMLLSAGCGQITTNNQTSDSKESSVAKNSSKAESTAQPTASVPETPVPTSGVFTTEQGYSDPNYEISILGLKEYKSIKTKKFTDTASKGKKYLVLFLKMRNRTNNTVYFNVNYLKAKLDGKKIKNTVLLNQPQNYPTMFSNIAADSYYGGFIVWEVPQNWKQLNIVYDGLKPSDGLSLKTTLTKKDLSNPEKYDAYEYEPNTDNE